MRWVSARCQDWLSLSRTKTEDDDAWSGTALPPLRLAKGSRFHLLWKIPSLV